MSESVSGAELAASDAAEERPHPARIYDYYLGGTHHLPADRAAADGFVKMMPGSPVGARANRRFLARAVRHATALGIRQFLDVGSGIPAVQATHEVAPDARVLYVDNDPIVGEYAQRILGERSDGRTAFVLEDVRNPEAILSSPEAKGLLDPARPVAVLFGAVLHFVLEEEDPHGMVDRYKRALAPGSAVILTHSSPDYVSLPVREVVDELYTRLRVPLAQRTRAEVERFVATDGWTVQGNGVVSTHEWETADLRPDDEDNATSREDAAGYGAMAVKD